MPLVLPALTGPNPGLACVVEIVMHVSILVLPGFTGRSF
jgi:hypothetical protein